MRAALIAIGVVTLIAASTAGPGPVGGRTPAPAGRASGGEARPDAVVPRPIRADGVCPAPA